MDRIEGTVWVFGDNVDTDQILPGYAMAEPFDKLHLYAMAGSLVSDFAKKVCLGDIIVAGKNFGCGSSREQAPVALKGAGVSMVIAASFARIFRRNAINIGLPVFTADISELVSNGDHIAVDLLTGKIEIGKKTILVSPLSDNVLATLDAGGLINRVKQEFGLVKGR